MCRYILILFFLLIPVAAHADCTVDHPCTKRLTLEQQHKAIWQRHRDLSEAAIADQKQRAADFEKQRLAVKLQEKTNPN